MVDWMRLPQYTASSPTTAVSRDPQERLQRASATIGLIDQAVGVAQQAQTAHDKFRTDQATVNLTAHEKAFSQENKNKQYYSAEELPDDEGFQKTNFVAGPNGEIEEQPREEIPAYEVQPLLYKQQMDAQVQAGSLNVPASQRADWTLRMQERVDQQYSSMIINAQNQQQTERNNIDRQDFNDALLNQDWQSALQIANAFAGPESVRRSMKNTAAKWRESGGYNDSISEDNIPAMQSNLKHLQDENYKDRLDPAERKAMISQLKTNINRANAKNEGLDKIEGVRIKNEARRNIKAVSNGDIVDPQELQMSTQQVHARFNAGDTSMAELVVELEESTELAPIANQFHMSSPTTQRAYIDNLPTKTGSDFHRKSQFIDMQKNSQRRIDTDTMTYASEIGMIDKQPVDFTNIDTLGEQLSQRVSSSGALENHFGSSTGPLTNDEVREFKTFFNDMSISDRLDLTGQITAELGPDASQTVFGQLSDDGDDVLMSAANQYAQGKRGTAELMLNGQQLLSDNPNMVQRYQSEVYPVIVDNIGGIYTMSSTENKRAIDGITAIYAGKSALVGDISGELNEQRLIDSTNEYTGPIGTIGGNKVLLPDNLTENQFRSYIRDLDPEGMPEVQGYTNNQWLKNDMLSGKVVLKGTGKNEFLLYSTVTNAALHGKDGPIKFGYDPNAKMSYRDPAKLRQKDQLWGEWLEGQE
jgi:hypothetical protein